MGAGASVLPDGDRQAVSSSDEAVIGLIQAELRHDPERAQRLFEVAKGRCEAEGEATMIKAAPAKELAGAKEPGAFEKKTVWRNEAGRYAEKGAPQEVLLEQAISAKAAIGLLTAKLFDLWVAKCVVSLGSSECVATGECSLE